MELHVANPKKYRSLKFYTQKNTWHQNFLPPKNARLSNSALIYLIKQTLRPQKIIDISIDPPPPPKKIIHITIDPPPQKKKKTRV